MIPRIILMLVLVVATVSGGVAAQGENTTVEVPGTDESETCNQYVSDGISLCSVDYVDGHAVLEFESESRERVTITEAVALTEYREINRESFVLDGRTTVRMPLNLEGGAGGVTVDDGSTLYGVPVRGSNAMFSGPWTASDAQAAGIGGALSVALITLLLVLNAVRGGTEGGERVA